MSDDLGDRMKLYEGMGQAGGSCPCCPSSRASTAGPSTRFTRGMERPYDPGFSAAWWTPRLDLVRETGACMGYTQSDEITLAWHSTDIKSQVWFDGRVQKMVSQLAAHATLHFYRLMRDRMPWYAERLPTFDARAWQVPNRTEGANAFLWREWDATKNSLSMAASAHYSHAQLHGKNGADKHDMLMAKGINWNDYPDFFKRGTYVQRRSVIRPFTAGKIESLPPKHAARTDPGLTVERTEWGIVAMPPLASVTNREAVIFDGAMPVLA
jgi:tRNA(His) guanylyltransferase